jgi:Domain of unknown function (DUF4232)
MRTAIRPIRHALPAALVAVVLVGGAACSSSSKKASTTTTSAAPTTIGSTAAGSTSTPASTTGLGTTTVPTTPRCVTGALGIRLGQPGAAAGNRYLPIVFTNTSGKACTLYGYPGVSLLDAAGKQIGAPASREAGSTPKLVTVAPGASASAAVHTAAQGVAPSCGPTSTQIRVYVPDERTAVALTAALADCGGVFSVLPVVPGTTGTP